MTHLRSKRLPHRGRALAAVTALIASFLVGALTPAEAAPPAEAASATAAPRWSDRPHGFASLDGGTTGGAGGKVVTVTGQAAPARYASAQELDVIRVAGAVDVAPFGSDIVVTSNKTIIGVGDTGEIVHGEPHLNPGTGNVITRLDAVSRVYIRDSSIEGDVDFLHGRATTVVERSLIEALSRGSDSNNGYITAASTRKDNPYGFLITRSKVVSDAPAGTYHLGRPWHPGGEPDAVAQVLFRDTELPAAVKSSPWTDMSGFSWKDARFTEYRTYGPGAGVTADRPQLDRADASARTVTTHLAGTDGRGPHRGRAGH